MTLSLPLSSMLLKPQWMEETKVTFFYESNMMENVVNASKKRQEGLTYMRGDDGEGAEVGLPHVLRQCVGVLLVAAQQGGRASLRVLDQLPVRPRVRGQDGTAHAHQVL